MISYSMFWPILFCLLRISFKMGLYDRGGNHTALRIDYPDGIYFRSPVPATYYCQFCKPIMVLKTDVKDPERLPAIAFNYIQIKFPSFFFLCRYTAHLRDSLSCDVLLLCSPVVTTSCCSALRLFTTTTSVLWS